MVLKEVIFQNLLLNKVEINEHECKSDKDDFPTVKGEVNHEEDNAISNETEKDGLGNLQKTKVC